MTAGLRGRRWPLVALAAAFVLLAVAAAVDRGSLLLHVDEPVQRAVVDVRSDAATRVFRAAARLGNAPLVLLTAVVAVTVAWWRCRLLALTVVAATLARPLYESLLKALVGRSRPELERLVDTGGPSFPSGHVLAVVALWGLVPAVVAAVTPSAGARRAAVAVSAAVVVIVSASRVYLGLHWVSDVAGGLAVGLLLLAAAEAALDRLHVRFPGACDVAR